MKITVIGATGLVGSAVVKELSQRGHEVAAVARKAERIESLPGVTAISMDVHSEELAQLLSGQDAVISAFNPGWTDPALAADFTKGYQSILTAAKTANVPYLLVVGGAGSLYVSETLQLVDTPDFPSEVYPMANAARLLLEDLKDRRDVNWAYISPAAMFAVNPVVSEAKGSYRIGKEHVLLDTNNVPADITLGDLANAIVDDVEQQNNLFRRFTVAN